MSGRAGGPIEILDRTTTKEIGERVEVEWTLSARPESEWIEIFQLAELSGREGSDDWVLGAGPDVVASSVRWFVPSDHIDDADEEVRLRLSIANQRFAA